MRRTLVALVAVFALVFAATPVVGAAGKGTGALMKSFNSGMVTGDFNPEGRVNGLDGATKTDGSTIDLDQCFESGTLLGLWFGLQSPDLGTFDEVTWDFELDGTLLKDRRTDPKPLFGAPGWFMANEGVPVLGVLADGFHTVEVFWHDTVNGDDTWSFDFYVGDCAAYYALVESFNNGMVTGDLNPEGRISPIFSLLNGGATQCIESGTVVGMWIVIATQSPDYLNSLNGVSHEFYINDVLQTDRRTPVKDMTYLDPDPWFGFAEGIPVLGVLPDGTYSASMHTTDTYQDIYSELDFTFQIGGCS